MAQNQLRTTDLDGSTLFNGLNSSKGNIYGIAAKLSQYFRNCIVGIYNKVGNNPVKTYLLIF